MKTKTPETEEQRGYREAKTVLSRPGADPQGLYDTSLGDLNQEGFAKGWQRACREAGAKEEDGFSPR